MLEAELAKPHRVSSLSFHAGYRCQNTGVCCSSGWEIAVESPVELRLRPRLGDATPRLPNGPDGFTPMATPPAGCRSAFRRTDAGTCWFRDPERRDCAIHREFGVDALASACRQFPRIAVLEPDQVSVSLSHFCPTAAGLLFLPSSPLTLVEAPKAFPSSWPYEGLDARLACSPLLLPEVLLGSDGLRSLEQETVKLLSEPGVHAGVARLSRAVGRIRDWAPSAGPMPRFVADCFDVTSRVSVPGLRPSDPRPVLRTSVPPGVWTPELPDFAPFEGTPSPAVDLALRRYVAARLVAGWILYLANDLYVTANYLKFCLDVAHLFEGARERSEPETVRWREAIRSSDLWILHHCDPELLAGNLR